MTEQEPAKKLTLQDASELAANNLPWTFRLELVRTSPNNILNKFWYATGHGLEDPVETGTGDIGTAPQTNRLDWRKLRKKVADKLAKCYVYVPTPYIGISAGSPTPPHKPPVKQTRRPSPDSFPVQAVLCFTYKNDKGEDTERVVEVNHVKTSNDGARLMVGFCRVRKDIRSFRLDRIVTCLDAETGDAIPDVYRFLYDQQA